MPSTNKYCVCGGELPLHKSGCPMAATVPLILGRPQQKPSGWVCPTCGWEAPAFLINPQTGEYQMQLAHVTHVEGEEHPQPHCNACWIRFLRANVPMLALKEPKDGRENGTDSGAS